MFNRIFQRTDPKTRLRNASNFKIHKKSRAYARSLKKGEHIARPNAQGKAQAFEKMVKNRRPRRSNLQNHRLHHPDQTTLPQDP